MKSFFDKVLLYYFCGFLLVDVINGLVINQIGASSFFSFGEVVRGIIICILIIQIVSSEHTKSMYFFVALIIYCVIFSLVCHHIYKHNSNVFFIEISNCLKLIYFLCVITYSYLECEVFEQYLDTIMKVNCVLLSVPVAFSYFTDIGFVKYDKYYYATSGFFLGNNPTAILGLVFCFYFTYRTIKNTNQIFYLLLSIVGLFLCGTKTFVIYPIILVYIVLHYIFSNYFELRYRILYCCLGVIICIFCIPIFQDLYFIIWGKYQARILSSLYWLNKSSIQMPWLFSLYGHISYGRATEAYSSISYMLSEHPIHWIFGYGNYFVTYQFPNDSNIITPLSKFSIESDIFDLLFQYGIVGILIVGTPIFLSIWRNRNNIFLFSSIIILFTIYGILAGHILFSPMASTILAVFLGMGINGNDGIEPCGC